MMARVVQFGFGSFIAAAIIVAWSAPATGEDAVEEGRQSLSQRKGLPWYDAEKDRIKRIDVQPDKAANPANRNSAWQKNPPTKKATTSARSSSDSFIGGMMRVLIGVLCAVALAAVIGLVIWSLLRSEERRTAKSGSVQSVDGKEVDRIEKLPFRVKRPQSDLLAEARRHYDAGNFNEAIIYLYSYQLVELDKQQRIRLTRGKTNRQYLREVRNEPSLSGLLESTMIAFEEVFFGHHELPRQQFESCWQRLDHFHQLLQGVAV